jgi:hypothetical protein
VAESLQPIKPPWFDPLHDGDRFVSRIWLKYFQSLAIQVFNGAVNLVSGTAHRIVVGGTQTAPVIDIAADYAGQSSINTLGTVTSGAWHGTPVEAAYVDSAIGRWKSFIIPYSTFAAASAGLDSVFVNFSTLAAGGMVHAVRITPLAKFSGGTVNQVQIATGRTDATFMDPGSPLLYSPLFDVGVNLTNGYSQRVPLLDGYSDTAATPLKAYLETTGGVVSDLIAGSVKISLLISVVP